MAFGDELTRIANSLKEDQTNSDYKKNVDDELGKMLKRLCNHCLSMAGSGKRSATYWLIGNETFDTYYGNNHVSPFDFVYDGNFPKLKFYRSPSDYDFNIDGWADNPAWNPTAYIENSDYKYFAVRVEQLLRAERVDVNVSIVPAFGYLPEKVRDGLFGTKEQLTRKVIFGNYVKIDIKW